MSTAKNIAEQCVTVFEAAEVVLKDWNFETKNLQFPDLANATALKLNVSGDRNIKEIDGLVRYFIYRHPEYTSKRGAGGGVTLTALEDQKRSTLAARKAAKQAVAVEVEQRLAGSTTASE